MQTSMQDMVVILVAARHTRKNGEELCVCGGRKCKKLIKVSCRINIFNITVHGSSIGSDIGNKKI